MDRRCPVEGCAAKLPAHIFVCARHWDMIPPANRLAVNQAWRAYNAARRRNDDDAWLAAGSALTEAQQAALETIPALR